MKNITISAFAGFLLAAWNMPGQAVLNSSPTRVVGHTSVSLVSIAPNLAEAKDLNNPSYVAVDSSASPPVLYIADTSNNRVLGWRNAASLNNGAPADIVIGQRGFLSTLPGGPGTQNSQGLRAPVALAVDTQGNLYVADGGNNRILRFPKPYQQPDDSKQADMVIGQPNFNQNSPNNPSLNANTIALSINSAIFTSGMVFDSAGNLYFSDSANNRVLRYPALALSRGLNQPSADAAIGQQSLTAALQPSNFDPRQNRGILWQPAGLAFDAAGRLYVCDNFNRVSIFSRPATGAIADRMLGILLLDPTKPPPPAVNDTQFGRTQNGRNLPPNGVFFAGGTPFVIDTANNRIMRFDPFESWPIEATLFSPAARQVLGQADFSGFKANRGLQEPSSSAFDAPVSAAVTATTVYIVENGNNRVMAFPIQAGTITAASNVVGQNEFFQSAPNNIDGREMFLYGGSVGLGNGAFSVDGGGLYIDRNSNPPHLYVADTYNNRVLGWRDARSAKQGDRADIVIGQPDFLHALINNPTNDSNQVTDNGLYLPAGVVVDGGGNLYVADGGNGRVLRYPAPFNQQDQIKPDLVLGQQSFFTKLTDASARNMARPYGLAFSADGSLLVSDIAHSRVLFFRKPQGSDFTNGQAAEKVFGQPDFVSINGGNAQNRFFSPHGISLDTDDRLYVADSGNSRLMVFDTITFADVDPFASVVLPVFQSPQAVWVNPATAEIWVADTGGNRVIRFPVYIQLLIGQITATGILQANLPIGITQDGNGNLFVADASNRISIYFPAVSVVNGGNQLGRYAPYTYATLRPYPGADFGTATVDFKDVSDPSTMPMTLGDLQVSVNDVPAPISKVAPDRIDVILPKEAPTTGNATLVIQRQSTGQIVAATTLTFAREAPSFFTQSGDGNGQIVAKNPDGTDNSAADRIGRSEIVSLFGTGFGVPGGAPPNGQANSDQLPGTGLLRVIVGTDFVPTDNVTYFGLAPGMIGVWQIDVKIPDKVAPDPNVLVTCQFNSVPCNAGDTTGRRVTTTIAVKP